MNVCMAHVAAPTSSVSSSASLSPPLDLHSVEAMASCSAGELQHHTQLHACWSQERTSPMPAAPLEQEVAL